MAVRYVPSTNREFMTLSSVSIVKPCGTGQHSLFFRLEQFIHAVGNCPCADGGATAGIRRIVMSKKHADLLKSEKKEEN